MAMKNKKLIVTTIEYPPFAVRGPNGTWGGMSFDILSEVARMLGFSYVVQEQQDGAWGIDIGNGTYNGMIGRVASGKADMGVNPFTITEGRHGVVDFSTPVFVDDIVLLMQKPKATGVNYFIEPLRWHVWLAAFLSTLVVSIIVTFFNICECQWRTSSAPRHTRSKVVRSFTNTLFKSTGIVFNQGLVNLPQTASSRIVFSFWWLIALILTATYSGNLTAFLTAKRIVLPIWSLEDIPGSALKMSVLKNSFTEGMFKNAKSGIYKEIYETNIKDMMARQTRIHHQFEIVLNDPNVLAVIPYKAFKYLHLNDPPYNYSKCLFSIPDITVFWNVAAFPMKKSGPYTEAITSGLLTLQASGVLQHIKDRYLGKKTCTGFEKTAPHTMLTLHELLGVFSVLFGGVMAGAVALVVETLWHRYAMYVHSGHREDKEE